MHFIMYFVLTKIKFCLKCYVCFQVIRAHFKVPTWTLVILHILLRKFILYILLAENFIFVDFFAVESDVNPEIYFIVKTRSYKAILKIYRLIPGLTSLPSTLRAKKSTKIILANKIYYNFLRSIRRLQICKISKDHVK